MTRSVQKNARLLAWHTALLTIFVMSVWVPFSLLVLGIDYQGVMLCQAVFSVTIIVMDVPTGLLADRWTRRRTVMVGTLFYALGEVMMCVLHGLAGGILIEILTGVGVSLLSGAKMALLYDSMVEAGDTADYQRQQGFNHAAGLYGTGIGALAGGWLFEWHPLFPAALGAGLGVLALGLTLFLAEPARHKAAATPRHPLADMLATMRYALHGHREIAGIVLIAAVTFAGTRLMFWAQQPYDEMLRLPVHWFGIIGFVYYIVSGLAGHFSHRLGAKMGDRAMLAACFAAVCCGCLVSGLLPGWGGLPLLLMGGVIYGFGWPRLQGAINARVDSSRRATILSTANFMVSCASIPLLLLMGHVQTAHGIAPSLVVSGGLIGVTGIVALCFYRGLGEKSYVD